MNDSTYAFLLKYSSPFSILVVTSEDKLIELKCPFTVRVLKNVKNMMLGETRQVTQVKLATNNALVYIIDNQPYFYHYFNIAI